MQIESTQSTSRLIWTLTWPQVLMMVFHFLIGFADVWVAGQIDARLQAALGIITQSLFFFLVIAMAVAGGGVAAITQSLGAGKILRAERYVGLCLLVAVVFGLIFPLVGLPTKDLFVRMLQVPQEIAPLTEYVLEIFLYALPPYYMLIVLNAVFRSRQQVMVPLYAMILVTVVNTLGDLGFGLGIGLPGLGPGRSGAPSRPSAWARSSACSCPPRRHPAPPDLAPGWVRCAAPYMFKVAWPAGLMQIVWHSGYLVLFAITASLPENSVVALAGMAAGARVESLLFLPAFALNLTASILVGHLLGAGQPEEARRMGLRILAIGLVGIVVITLLLWTVLDPLTGFLAPNPEVKAQALDYLTWNMLAIPFTLTTMILAGALGGAGATLYNLLGMGMGTWLVRLPLAYILGHLVLGRATGVWMSMLASQACQAAILYYIFIRKDWQRFAMYNKHHGKH
jgi:Na+-driven multidrug efflux pump